LLLAVNSVGGATHLEQPRIIKGLERLPLTAEQPQRLDVLFTTSGLFRDLYGEHLVLLDKASLLALDASRDLIIRIFSSGRCP